MPIKIDSEVKEKIQIDFEKYITDLLAFVPPDHLMHLDQIVVSYFSPDKKNNNALGFYYHQTENKPAYVVLCARNIMQEINETPTVIRIFFLTPRYHIAKTLYHELGHHYQYIRHGYKKETQERYAEKYRRYMLRKIFWSSKFGRILFPFKPLLSCIFVPIVNFLKKKVNDDTTK